MQKKRLFSCFLILILGLSLVITGCGGKNTEKTESGEETPVKFGTEESNGGGIFAYSKDGIFLLDNDSMLHFFDYRAKKTVLVCDRADCKHQPETEGENTCHAKTNADAGWFVYGNKIYTFEIVNANQLILREKGTDGNNEKELLRFEGFQISEGMVYENQILFVNELSSSGSFDPKTKKSSGYRTQLCVYDMKSQKMKILRDEKLPSYYAFYIYKAADDCFYFYDGQKNGFYTYDIASGEVKAQETGYKKNLADDKIYGTAMNGYLYGYQKKGKEEYILRKSIETGEEEELYKVTIGKSSGFANISDGMNVMCIDHIDTSGKAARRVFYRNDKEQLAIEITGSLTEDAKNDPVELATDQGIVTVHFLQSKEDQEDGDVESHFYSVEDLKKGNDNYTVIYHQKQD